MKRTQFAIVFGAVIVSLLMSGCGKRYIPLDTCPYPTPPEPEKFLVANDDEKLAMTAISQAEVTEAIVNCNLSIRHHNKINEAKFN